MDVKSHWYYEKQGKAEGPISTLAIVQKIQDGELNLLDLVFKEGEGQWAPAESFSEIKQLVKTTATHFKADADWVVLKFYEVDGVEQFVQLGPFSVEQILQHIDQGKIQFTDYVWRNGYENWVPLGRVDEFESSLESSVKVDLSLYEKPRREWENVAPATFPKIYKAKKKIKEIFVEEKEKPVEASGKDLSLEKWKTPVEVVAKKKEPEIQSSFVEETVKVDKSRLQEQETEEKELKQERAYSRWQGVASFLVVFIFLCGATLSFVYGRKIYLAYQRTKYKEIVFEPVTKMPLAESPRGERQPAPPPPPTPAVTPAASVVAKSQPEPAKPVKKDVATAKEDASEVENTSQMTEKQRSYFYEKERLFLFYNAQKGQKLVQEAEQLLKKADKKKNKTKSDWSIWGKKTKTLNDVVRTESLAGSHLYPALFKKLVITSRELEERSSELSSQIANRRGPSKVTTLQEIGADFKKIMKQARDL